MKQEQKCYKCQKTKPLTKEFFAKDGKNKSGKIAYDRICKECKKKWNEEYYKTHEKPKLQQEYVGKFLIRYSSRINQWTVFIKEPWARLESFDSLEEAKEWIASKQ